MLRRKRKSLPNYENPPLSNKTSHEVTLSQALFYVMLGFTVNTRKFQTDPLPENNPPVAKGGSPSTIAMLTILEQAVELESENARQASIGASRRAAPGETLTRYDQKPRLHPRSAKDFEARADIGHWEGDLSYASARGPCSCSMNANPA